MQFKPSSKCTPFWRTILLGLITVNALFAGTTGKISGRVVDGETGTPLPGVNVMIENTVLGASTDPDGIFFIINIPVGTYIVRAEMIGYTPMRVTEVEVRSDLTTEVNFELTVRVLESDQEVVVVAERPMVQKDLTSGRAIVGADEIKEMPVESLSAVISTKAGIVADAGGGIHVRGGRSSEISYLIDGVPITNPAWGGLGVGLENSAVQELQILSGTFNAEYGQAMSGIINIVTKEGGQDFNGSFSGYLGDYRSTNTDIFEHGDEFDLMNIRNLEGSLSGPIPIPGLQNKFSFFVSGRLYNNGGLYRGVREHSPSDVNFLTSRQVEDLRDSPYGRAGLLNFAEPFSDTDGDGMLAEGSEAYIDFDGSGNFEPGEPFRDVNGNGWYDHNLDLNFDDITDAEEREFVDLNGDGVLNGDPFFDFNGNGVLDGEPFIDFNQNGVWDDGATGDGSIIRMNTIDRYNLQGKITWRITPKMKLNINTLRNFSETQSYTRLYKYNPDGRPTSQNSSTSLILDFTHSLSERLFYNIKGSYYESYSKSFYHDVEPDEIVDSVFIDYGTDLTGFANDVILGELDEGTFYGSDADSLLVLSVDIFIVDSAGFEFHIRDDVPSLHGLGEQVLFFLDLMPGWLISARAELVVNDVTKALFLPNEITEAPDNEFYGGGHSHSFSERRNQTYLLSGAITWQMNNTHQFKTGASIKQHYMGYRGYTVSVDRGGEYDWIPVVKDTRVSLANDSYNNWLSEDSIGMSRIGMQYTDRRPTEIAFYVQDKIELTDMIVNLGLRYDYFNPNYFVPDDYKDPDNPKYYLYTVETGEEGMIDTLFSQAGEVGDFIELLDTLDAQGAQWRDYPDYYQPVDPVHQFSPRIGVAYPITDRGIIHFSYGHFFQIPTFAYLYLNPEMEISSDNFESTLGNAGLKPQKTVTYEIGLQQQLTDDLGIEVIAFYKDFSGLLSSEIQERYNTVRYTVYTNSDYGNSRGITLSVTKRRTGLLSAAADYTYQVAQGNASDPKALYNANQTDPPLEVTKKVIPLNWDQRHTVNVNVSLSKPRKWGVTALMKYGSGLPYTPSFQGFRVDKPNSDRRPTYFNVDVNAHKDVEIMGLHLNVFAKIYNLFDTMNERSVFTDTGRATYSLIPTYTVDHGNETGRHSLADWLNRPNYFSSPRQFRLGVSVAF